MKPHLTVVTGSRAEFYLMLPVIKKLQISPKVILNIVVIGGHFDVSMKESLKDIKTSVNAPINLIPINPKNDESTDISNQVSATISQFSKWLVSNKCDMILVLGDRHEILGVCTTALIHRIPIAHIHGGDVSEGAIDESIRHSITKMATYHFPATKLSKLRILQMGEIPDYVIDTGSLGVENAQNNSYLGQAILKKPYTLLTCHPETILGPADINKQQDSLYDALMEYSGKVLITRSNFDEGGELIYKKHQKWVLKNPQKFQLVNNLGNSFHANLQKADFCIGNSSSALIEAPALKTPSINIGVRQKGRERGNSVVQCAWSKNEIIDAIELCLDSQWLKQNDRFSSPYQCRKIKPSDIIVDKLIDYLVHPAPSKIFQMKPSEV